MLLLALACTLPRAPRQPIAAPAAVEPWADLATPGPITHTATISAYAEAKVGGLVNLDNPDAAALSDDTVQVGLIVHALHHPTHGTVYIDTGVPEKLAARGIARLAAKQIETVTPLGEIIAEHGTPAGVILTHTHPDHIFGLPDVPVGTTIYVGQGEWEPRGQGRGLLRRSIKATFGDHAFTELAFDGPVGDFPGVLDLWGDGSVFIVYTPGHTPGSLSVVARTTEGGMLFTGDTSHTLWGWVNGVEPGGFTVDTEKNARSLAALKALAEAHDLTVWVGHETDGAGTGVDGR